MIIWKHFQVQPSLNLKICESLCYFAQLNTCQLTRLVISTQISFRKDYCYQRIGTDSQNYMLFLDQAEHKGSRLVGRLFRGWDPMVVFGFSQDCNQCLDGFPIPFSQIFYYVLKSVYGYFLQAYMRQVGWTRSWELCLWWYFQNKRVGKYQRRRTISISGLIFILIWLKYMLTIPICLKVSSAQGFHSTDRTLSLSCKLIKEKAQYSIGSGFLEYM